MCLEQSTLDPSAKSPTPRISELSSESKIETRSCSSKVFHALNIALQVLFLVLFYLLPVRLPELASKSPMFESLKMELNRLTLTAYPTYQILRRQLLTQHL